MVTLTGPGGVGKTRLALHAAGQLVDTAADGVWWVDLTPLSEPMQLADAILRALEDQPGGRLAAPRVAGAEPEEQLRWFLSDRDLLLVLDNAEHLAEAVGHLVGGILTRAPGLRILATSQRPLNTAGEAVWSVPPLPVPPPDADLSTGAMLDYPSVQLFADRAAAAGGIGDTAEDDTAAVAEICRTLDGMPLAIELAAARTRLLPPHQLLARLHDRFSLLTTRSGSGPARQRSLRAVVEWSHHLLTGPERVLLRRLAVFVGGARLDAVEQVCAEAPGQPWGRRDHRRRDRRPARGPGRQVPDHGGGRRRRGPLHDAGDNPGLLRRNSWPRPASTPPCAPPTRATTPILPPPRSRSCTDPTSSAGFSGSAPSAPTCRPRSSTPAAMATVRPLCGWPVRSVSSGGSPATYPRVTGSPRSLCTPPALRPARTAPPPLPFVARLDAVTGKHPRAGTHSRGGGGVLPQQRRPRRGSTADRAAGPGALSARPTATQPRAGGASHRGGRLAWSRRADAVRRDGRHERRPAPGGAPAHDRAGSFRLLGDRWGQAESLWRLGAGLANIRGRYEQALQTLDEGVELATQLGNTEQTIGMLAVTGNILVLTGDYPGAQERHEEALRLAHRLSLPSVIAFIRNGMGLCARRQGDSRLARAHHEHALAIYERGRLQSGAAVTHAWLGYTAELDGDADQAEAHHLRSLALARQSGDPRAIALPLEGLAGVAVLRADYQRCATLLGAATAIRASVDAPLPPAERIDVDRAAGAARAHLHDSAFKLPFDQGAGMNMDAACAYATTDSSS